ISVHIAGTGDGRAEVVESRPGVEHRAVLARVDASIAGRQVTVPTDGADDDVAVAVLVHVAGGMYRRAKAVRRLVALDGEQIGHARLADLAQEQAQGQRRSDLHDLHRHPPLIRLLDTLLRQEHLRAWIPRAPPSWRRKSREPGMGRRTG